MAELPARDVRIDVGAFGTVLSSDELPPLREVYPPVFLTGITTLDGREKELTPEVLMAATVKEWDEPARNFTRV